MADEMKRQMHEAMVVISLAEYDRLRKPCMGLAEWLRRSPLAGSGLVAERDPSPGRGTKAL